MKIKDLTITIFYFFRFTASESVPNKWQERLVKQLWLQPHPHQNGVWHNEEKTRFMDMEETAEFKLIRVSLTRPRISSPNEWQLLGRQLIINHKTLSRQTAVTDFLGCSLLYWGLLKEPNPNAPYAWLRHIPVHEAIPAARAANLRCGRLWQVQTAQPHQPENIYGLLELSTQEDAINQQLIYHPAFWQAEAHHHAAQRAWHIWQTETQPELQATNENLHTFLEEVPLTTTNQPSRRQLEKLGQQYNTLQYYANTLVAVTKTINHNRQRYRELMTALLQVAKQGDLVVHVLMKWQEALETLKIEEQALLWLEKRIANSLHHYQMLSHISQQEITNRRLLWVMRLTALAWGIRAFSK